jgi:hypothetical protein
MRPWPKCFAILVALCLSTGCKQQQKPSSPQIIYAGLGVSNYVEIGMMFADVAKRNPDAEFERVFPSGTPFWKRPFIKPSHFEMKVPSVGAESWQKDDLQPITLLHFRPDRLPPSVLRTGSNRILFDSGNAVLRQEIINAFGEPDHHIAGEVYPAALLNQGESVCFTNWGTERLFYPRRGAGFFLKDGTVTTFTIVKKFDGKKTPVPP